MVTITVKQMPAFKRVYKRLHKQQIASVNQAIQTIINNPEIGQEEKGELSGVYVYKFKIDRQLYLLAYEWKPAERLLVTLGVHENFYRDLKRSTLH